MLEDAPLAINVAGPSSSGQRPRGPDQRPLSAPVAGSTPQPRAQRTPRAVRFEPMQPACQVVCKASLCPRDSRAAAALWHWSRQSRRLSSRAYAVFVPFV